MAATLPMITPEGLATRLPGVLETSEADLLHWLAEQGEKPLRARQLRHNVVVRGALSFDQMTDLPQSLRGKLGETFVPLASRVSRHLESADGTHKLLLE